MSIKKKHMNWMMLCKRPLGASLWAILFFFIFTACQDDLPYEDTEVMMTFTTRAVVSDVVASNAPDEDKMKDLRVIMLRQNGTVVDNHLKPDINASSVTFTFTTPIQTGGEDFTFLAVANEESIQSESELSWLSCSPGDKLSEETITQIKEQQIGDGSAFNISDGAIPQSKQWTVHVPQADTKIPTQRLDFVASKVSVEFKNETNKEQTLKNVSISGFGSATQAYLFKQNGTDFVGQQGVSDKYLLGDEGLTIPVGKSDSLKYYTYPVNTISTPTLLHAQWKQGEEYKDCSLDLSGITSLPRNQHLKILITLTDVGLDISYVIAEWVDNQPTYIGQSPSIGDDGYDIPEWGDGTDVNIGGGDEPDTPVEPGDVIWYMNGLEDISPNYSNPPIQLYLSNEVMEKYFVEGNVFGVNYDISSDNGGKEFYIRKYDIGGGYNMNTLPSASGNVFSNDGVNEFVLTADDIAAINLNDGTGRGGISFWGNSITVTQIYIKVPETQ